LSAYGQPATEKTPSAPYEAAPVERRKGMVPKVRPIGKPWRK